MNNEVQNPILFTTFNRLETTKRVFAVIKTVKPNRLYFTSDGPRKNVKNEHNIIKEIREYVLANIDWPCEIKTLFRNENLGCKVAMNEAITWFFSQEEQGIILEDDCLPNLSFFKFCDELLEKYKHDEQIGAICGSNLNDKKIGEADYYFKKVFNMWGWATWRKIWEKNKDLKMEDYLNFKKIKKIKDIWADERVQKYWLDIFDEVYSNRIISWAYPLTYSFFKNNLLSVCPNKNLVSNIGFGDGATHTLKSYKEVSDLKVEQLDLPLKHPEGINYQETNDYYINNFNISIFYTKYYNLKKLLKKMGLFSVLKRLYLFLNFHKPHPPTPRPSRSL